MKSLEIKNTVGTITIVIDEKTTTAKIKIEGEYNIEQIKALLQGYKNCSGIEGSKKLTYDLQSIVNKELMVGGNVAHLLEALQGLELINANEFNELSSYLAAPPTNATKTISSIGAAVSGSTAAATADSVHSSLSPPISSSLPKFSTILLSPPKQVDNKGQDKLPASSPGETAGSASAAQHDPALNAKPFRP